MQNFHEDFKDSYSAPEISERGFGYSLGAILCGLAVIKAAVFGWWIAAGIFGVIGAGLIATGYFAPSHLQKPRDIFIRISPAIARIVNPVLMGFIYLICFIPAGYILKALKRDPLNRNWNPYATTYWTKRGKHELPEPMKYQF